MEDMSRAIEEQRMLFARLGRLNSEFENIPSESKSRGLAQTFLSEIEEVSKAFKSNHEQIYDYALNTSVATNDVPYLKEDLYTTFLTKYLVTKGTLLDISSDYETANPSGLHASTFHVPSFRNESFSADVRLPKIDIPTFYGDYLEWISYRDMFVSLVHNNAHLSKVQKYYFLKNSCKETPLSIVNEYPASDSSYDLAWSALSHRYHNKRKICDTIFRKLFDIPKSDGSCESTKKVLDITRSCLALFSTLKINCEHWDPILIHITTGKLDIQTCKEWEQSLKASTEIPSIKELFTFLETTFRTLEAIHDHTLTPSKQNSNKQHFSKNYQTRRVHTVAFGDDNCPCCAKRHMLYKCFKFAALPSAAKRELVLSKNVCRNCLNVGHSAQDCKLQTRCKICNAPHHTIIHNEFSQKNSNPGLTGNQIVPASDGPSTSGTQDKNNSNLHCNISLLSATVMPQVLLATVRVMVQTPYGNFKLRALLDQGAQATLITENAAQILKLKRYNTFARINGIGDSSTIVRKCVSFCLTSSFTKQFKLECNAFIMSSLTQYCPGPITRSDLPDLSEFDLADPDFDKNDKIDLLIGGDIYGDIILPRQKKFKRSIFLQLSQFGWVVSGPTAEIYYSGPVQVHLCSLDTQLKAFWEQEELLEKRKLTPEEDACETFFKKTTKRSSDGRYTVALPFKSVLAGRALPTFSHTDYNALKRLKTMENRFTRDKSLAQEYTKFMREYESLGHMRKVGIYPQDLKFNGYFLPHHGVLRESSSTTKLRVVFDGSSKRPPHPSLNEELSPGPALQNDLPTIITRWRRFNVGFRSDLEKMFRQIRVADHQTHYQQILWRDSLDSEIFIYKLLTVTYGTSPAPYLSIRILHELAREESQVYPEACNILKSDTYVDDVISGADSVPEAKHLQQQLVQLLATGGFNLRKWTSNSPELMAHIPEDYREKINMIDFDEQTVVKALGLAWNIEEDYFTFKVNFVPQEVVTKSSLLSDASKLYDPLGWLAPVTINAKITFQKLWLEGIDWKDPVSSSTKTGWICYLKELKNLERVQIPRWIGTFKNSSVELHGFCDASQSAFAAVVYVKVLDSGSVNLVQSKTKVAPLKVLSIPKLELCGATLLAKLMEKVKIGLEREITAIWYWTDSMTALCWLRGESSKWSVYVGNRVAEVQRLTNVSQWRYISTNDNPADCASRGISSVELLHHKQWWFGPDWLSLAPQQWPAQPTISHDTSLELRKPKIAVNLITGSEYPDIFSKFSSISRLIRVTAYVLRFIHNARQQSRENRLSGYLSTKELNLSLQRLVILAQRVDFAEELDHLPKNKCVHSGSKIAALCPFLDEDGVLRVGGRLKKAKFNYEFKHPIILAKHNPLSLLIFADAHLKTLHGGLIQMQAYVTRKFWILSARNLAKNVQRRCITCFKYKAQTAQQIMGDLPAVRLQPSRPFKHSGVDYAGPITIKQSTARNTVTTKGYICLFICMVSKALHLEAVTSLSTDSFLAAFRRFTARRGVCTDLYSDCGTNFIGSNKELKILQRRSRDTLPNELAQLLSNTGTIWHFIPPASPNFGGLWEAGVKSTKHHLKRIMGNRILTYEELATLLAQIEGCLNSRPLCPLSTDPTECEALTPAHFLIGEPILNIPEEDIFDVNIDRLSRWKVVESLKQHFWKRWVNEYVSRLQARPKWLKPQKNIEIGDLVLIFDERLPPGQWPLARVTEVHPGSDGKVRVVTIWSNGKTYKRPVSKIALLPMNSPLVEPNDQEELL